MDLLVKKNDFPALIMQWVLFVLIFTNCHSQSPTLNLEISQLTSGIKHHFFGYIGQCKTIPWNASGRYILGLEIDSIHRMPRPEEAAVIFLSIPTMKIG